MASAVCTGSLASTGPGARLVLTEQKRHPRVHVSPISCMWRARVVRRRGVRNN